MAQVRRGTVSVLFAFDVGLSVDLDEARRHVTDRIESSRLDHKRHAPGYFQFEPPPLRIVRHGAPVEVAGRATAPAAEIALYDFGALSVRLDLAYDGPLEGLVGLSVALSGSDVLLREARRHVDEVLGVVGGAVVQLRPSPLVEDYLLFRIEELAGTGEDAPAEDFLVAHAATVARILGSSEAVPSREEVSDLLDHRTSYGPDDLTVVDWNGALVLGRDMDDVVDVLEYANVQLLEMRYLDERLDQALDRSYASLLPGREGTFRLSGSAGVDLPRIARMQVDAAILFERVTGALKLLGDQWLARVHRLAARRFHLHAWNEILLRKLDTIDSIYRKLFDRASSRRMETLEWLIIVLITVSIVLPFLL